MKNIDFWLHIYGDGAKRRNERYAWIWATLIGIYYLEWLQTKWETKKEHPANEGEEYGLSASTTGRWFHVIRWVS